MSAVSTARRARRIGALAAALVGLVGLASPASLAASAPRAAHTALTARGAHLSPAILRAPHYVVYAGTVSAGTTFSCQLTTPAQCYGPQQIRRAYEIQPLLDRGITGKGRTIVIVDAFQSPTITQDLHTFDTLFGLPDPPALNIVAPDGLTPFDQSDADQTGWAGEITLDVEWAHAIAPDAAIDLVLAKSDQDADILSATTFAVDHNLGDVLSQSFGEAESCMDPSLMAQQHRLFQQATAARITLFASSGDQGAAQPTCDGTSFFKSVSTPASDPYVTGVGGTILNADGTTGAYIGETAWNEPDFQAAGGGGFSTVYRIPVYQRGVVPGAARGVPDVAYNAAIIGGVLAVWSSSGQGANLVFQFGGTSAGSPQWAGITALADQLATTRLGLLNPAFYLLGRTPFYGQFFHDITTGDNTYHGAVTIAGYSAGVGWDPVTGWGSPRVAQLALLARLVNPARDSAISAVGN